MICAVFIYLEEEFVLKNAALTVYDETKIVVYEK